MWKSDDFILDRYKVLRDKHNFTPLKIIDIGAHIGDWYKTIKSIYPNSEVLSVDANVNCENQLSQNNPNYLITFLGKKEGVTDFYVPNDHNISTGASSYKEQTSIFDGVNPKKLQVSTLDSLNQQFDFIKMDVQGSELDIIKGGKKTIYNATILQLELSMLEYNQGAPRASEIISYLYNLGFELFDIGSFYYLNDKLNQSDMLFVNKSKFNIHLKEYEKL